MRKKRKAVPTTFNCYAKKRRQDYRKDIDVLTRQELLEEWNALPHESQAVYEVEKEALLARGPFLHSDLINVLKQVNGSATWRELEVRMGNNIVSHETIRTYVKILEGFKYTKNRIFPSLDAQAKARRLRWANSFWLFWTSAKILSPKIKILYAQMDEKWFYALVLRTNLKTITSLGIEPVAQKTHHKSHMHKLMAVVVSAFIPKDNDIEKGGKVFKVSIERAGQMLQAIKDSYTRIYCEDGIYHYPHIIENRL